LADSGKKGSHEDGGGNDGPWTPRKTNSRFPSAPTALGNRKLRDSHISTAATKQWKSGKPKAGFPLSHCLRFAFYHQVQKGGLAAELRSFSRLIVRLEYARQFFFVSRMVCMFRLEPCRAFMREKT
jgi:hypothetical protein